VTDHALEGFSGQSGESVPEENPTPVDRCKTAESGNDPGVFEQT
jgi:hypothetical protein